VAKSGYVKSKSGWVSDRTACYLASGKPAVVQSTGFEARLPVGKGLLTYTTVEEAVEAIAAINSDYLAHSHKAREIAEEYFDSDVVLDDVLGHVGLHP
jgi:glycosyltransferase involved in cell wall biosynthesis